MGGEGNVSGRGGNVSGWGGGIYSEFECSCFELLCASSYIGTATLSWEKLNRLAAEMIFLATPPGYRMKKMKTKSKLV